MSEEQEIKELRAAVLFCNMEINKLTIAYNNLETECQRLLANNYKLQTELFNLKPYSLVGKHNE